ncbi:MaoC family dehydratase [Paracoccus sp. S-4012]|uniref:MaoC/PaaZ C-terminal domain-containing protein n=1 Tax=Paracoccus sp. S-4012 TaxID=2665648 RepID=UPI0012B01008|nr:MaoC/PaaZ C-terminal domain-containing protein [Paracoccus sp. S-4012]MRX51140.1 MaoC family dehydratase [Paracoccus sp. S-4012]
MTEQDTPTYVSGTRLISQEMIDAFAVLTGDDQFIHTDPVRAAATPFGGTVAHGFLLLSLLSALSYEALPGLPGQRVSVNAGFDRIRFVRPCPAGATVRAVFTPDGQTAVAPGQVSLRWQVRLEDAAAPEPPILTATWLHRIWLEA